LGGIESQAAAPTFSYGKYAGITVLGIKVFIDDIAM